MRYIKFSILAIVAGMLCISCISVEDIALNTAADMLSSESGGAGIFTQDDDPQLIADALPLALKMYEMVLASRPEHAELQYSTGKNFIMYSNAFIHTPAGMLDDEAYEEQEAMLLRAKKMYLRGRDYIFQSLELRYPGFASALDEKRLDDALLMTQSADDARLLYWCASGWIGAYSCDPFDFEMANKLYIPAAMLLRALELDGEFSRGAVHDIFIQIYASLPSSHISKAAEAAPDTAGAFYSRYYSDLGIENTAEARTEYHFKRAIELAEGNNPGTYCTYASAVCVKNQDYRQFRQLLELALEINPGARPEDELIITIYQDKARWLLEHAEDFFISLEDF